MADGLDGAGWVLYESVDIFGQVELCTMQVDLHSIQRKAQMGSESLKGW